MRRGAAEVGRSLRQLRGVERRGGGATRVGRRARRGGPGARGGGPRGGPPAGRRGAAPAGAAPVRLAAVAASGAARWRTGLGEFDYVLGGGLVPGSVVLVGGEPGIGKSTLLLQCAARLEAAGVAALYVSGEESPAQVRLRADRLSVDAGAVHVLGETRLDAILHHARALGARVVVVDSIQTTY